VAEGAALVLVLVLDTAAGAGDELPEPAGDALPPLLLRQLGESRLVNKDKQRIE